MASLKLEDLLKLSPSELRKLSLQEFEGLSIDERINLIEAKEKEYGERRDSGGFSGIFDDLVEYSDITALTQSICPELIERRETERYIADYNRRLEKIKANRKKQGNINKDFFYPWEFEDLSKKQQEMMHVLEGLNVLTEDFRPRDVFEIFQIYDKMKFRYYESGSAYCAEDALNDVLQQIRADYPQLPSSKQDKIFVVILSQGFLGKDYILGNGVTKIKEIYGNNPDCEINVMVATDGDLRGSCDLAVRLIIY